MLSKIRISENEILLHDSISGLSNIYNIDSLSLLIGENGSGKTRILCEIIKKFTSFKDRYYHDGCRVYDVDGVELFDYDLSSWGVVYFTPLPYRAKINARTANFINASPKLSIRNDMQSIIDHKSILDEFGINPHGEVSRRTNYTRALNVILDLIAAKNIECPQGLPGVELLFQVPQLRKDVQRIKDDRGKIVGENNSVIIIDMQKRIDDIISTSARHLAELLRSNYGDTVVFSVLTLIEYCVIKKKPSKSVVVALLSEFFSLSPKRTFKPSSDSVVILDKAKALLTFLEESGVEGEITYFGDFNNGFYASFLIEIDPYNDNAAVEKTELKDIINVEFSGMSSGELALIYQLVKISEAITSLHGKKKKSILLLIDEGDAFLHLRWQQKYISTLNKLLGRLKVSLGIDELQAVLASHSPLLATDVPSNFICRLDRSNQQTLSGFAAPLFSLLSTSFNANSIGEFASQKINEVIDRISNNKVSEQDRNLISRIDNNIIRTELERLLLQSEFSGRK